MVTVQLLTTPRVGTLIRRRSSRKVARVRRFKDQEVVATSSNVRARVPRGNRLTVGHVLIRNNARASRVIVLTRTVSLRVLTVRGRALPNVGPRVARNDLHDNNVRRLTVRRRFTLRNVRVTLSSEPRVEFPCLRLLTLNTLTPYRRLTDHVMSNVTSKRLRPTTANIRVRLRPSVALQHNDRVLAPL